MDKPALIYTTFPDRQTAEEMASKLVRARLAACVNIFPGLVSVYAWKGQVERGEEVAALVKTREGCLEAAMSAIRDLHPYETPSILALPVSAAEPATLSWLLAETGA